MNEIFSEKDKGERLDRTPPDDEEHILIGPDPDGPGCLFEVVKKIHEEKNNGSK